VSARRASILDYLRPSLPTVFASVNMLGYKTFHMWEVFNDLDRLNAGWTNIYQSE
jgi:hypothetical protein